MNIKNLKKEILKMAYASKEGHLGSSFSILDILVVLYDQILRVDPKNPSMQNRDRFVLSKGHASFGLYAVLAEKGFFSKNLLKEACQFDNILGGHPDMKKVPGVEVSSGSLGHGFPMAVGMALGLKIAKKKARVYTIIGDGECNEGTIWESALLAPHHKLNNLSCVVDYNHSNDRALKLMDLVAKFKSFGWETLRIPGHDHKKIYKALKTTHKDKPVAIIAETTKGKGSKTMENNHAWHHKTPTAEELEIIINELS